jgi:hypothetical protein
VGAAIGLGSVLAPESPRDGPSPASGGVDPDLAIGEPADSEGPVRQTKLGPVVGSLPVRLPPVAVTEARVRIARTSPTTRTNAPQASLDPARIE